MIIGQRKKRVCNQLRDFIIDNLNTLPRPVHYVQVGANDGKLDDPVFEIARASDWYGLLIEPNPLYFSELARRLANRPKFTLLQTGISDAPGQICLFHVNPKSQSKFPRWAKGCASLNRERLINILSKHGEVVPQDIDETKVEMQRLDNVLANHHIIETDLLVVDVEGHELNVLKSFDLKILRPKLVVVESNDISGSNDSAIRDILVAAGYILHRFGDDLVGHSPDYPRVNLGSLIDFVGFDRLETGGVERVSVHPTE